MVEAGANQVPEAKLLEALDLAQKEIVKLCEAQEELRAKAGKAKWLDADVTASSPRSYGGGCRKDQGGGLQAAGSIVGEIVEDECGKLSLNSSEADIVKETQVRMALTSILEQQRNAAVTAPVREQFETELKGLTDTEQDSKELKSAKSTWSTPGSSRPSICRSRWPTRRRRVHEGLRQASGRRRSTRTSSARRSRSTSAVPTAVPSRRSARSSARSASARAPTARPSSPAARRRSCRCSRSARPRKASGSTTSRSRRIAATCTTTTSRRSRSVRRAA